MAKTKKAKNLNTTYRVLAGFDTSNGDRYEIDDAVKFGDIPGPDIQVLLEMEAIEADEGEK